MKKTMLLVTLMIIVGAFVLSASVYADTGSPAGKAITQTTSQQITTAKPVSSATVAKTPLVRTIVKSSFGFWLRHFLGLPPIQIETKPPDSGEPLKSVGEKGNADNWTGKPLEPQVDQDNGGSSEDI